jgi:hypothetical protein
LENKIPPATPAAAAMTSMVVFESDFFETVFVATFPEEYLSYSYKNNNKTNQRLW